MASRRNSYEIKTPLDQTGEESGLFPRQKSSSEKGKPAWKVWAALVL